MKWGVENVRITLKDDSGETVVIEQNQNGEVRCAQQSKAKESSAVRAERRSEPVKPEPAKPADPAKSEDKKAATAENPKRPKGRRGPRKSKPDSTPKAVTKPEAPKGRPGSLEWAPTKDSKAWGVVARSGSGQFKVLRTASSVWALFYERLDADGALAAQPEPLGCFPVDQEDKARARAQQHHDKGMAVAPIMAEAVYEMCPAPTPGSTEARQTRRGRKPKDAANTSPPVEPVAPASVDEPVDPEMDAKIMGGLDEILAKHLPKG